jgi:pyrroline-5-carboxylate reductase
MADALIHGIIRSGRALPGEVMVTNRSNTGRLHQVRLRHGVRITRSKATLARRSDVILLCVKPPDAAEVLSELRGLVRPRHVVVSVIAGLPVAFIERELGAGIPVVRAMPNISCRVGESATVLASGTSASSKHLSVVEHLLSAVGSVTTVPEEWLDAVTGLSGSGPAYVYYLMEALAAGGVKAGLPASLASELTLQTVLGAAKMVKATGRDPSALRRDVMSPGGTTVAGLSVLDEAGFRQALEEAVRRAADRSRGLRAFCGPAGDSVPRIAGT